MTQEIAVQVSALENLMKVRYTAICNPKWAKIEVIVGPPSSNLNKSGSKWLRISLLAPLVGELERAAI